MEKVLLKHLVIRFCTQSPGSQLQIIEAVVAVEEEMTPGGMGGHLKREDADLKNEAEVDPDIRLLKGEKALGIEPYPSRIDVTLHLNQVTLLIICMCMKYTVIMTMFSLIRILIKMPGKAANL